MKTKEFQNLLFQSAICMMFIDGIILDNETDELFSIVKKTPYFLDFEYEEQLGKSLNLIKKEGKAIINNLLSQITNSDLNEKQELILIEVLLKICEADKIVNNEEIKFLNIVKSKLKITNEILIGKFPRQIKYLIDFSSLGKFNSFETGNKLE